MAFDISVPPKNPLVSPEILGKGGIALWNLSQNREERYKIYHALEPSGHIIVQENDEILFISTELVEAIKAKDKFLLAFAKMIL